MLIRFLVAEDPRIAYGPGHPTVIESAAAALTSAGADRMVPVVTPGTLRSMVERYHQNG